jgi:cell division transport system permease protein
MNLLQFRYLLGEAFRALGRRKMLHGLAVLIMSFSLLFLAVFALVTLNVNRLFQEARRDLVVRVYLQEGLGEADNQDIQQKLYGLSGVTGVSYVSKEEALERFRAQLGEEASVVDALETNPLPASFELYPEETLKTSGGLGRLAGEVESMPGVERVSYGREILSKLEEWLRIFLLVDLVVGLVVIASAIFVVSNTVRLTVLSRVKTIEILKMVGATNTFIRTPFLLEGMIQGLVAGLLALALLRAAHALVASRVGGLLFLGWPAMLSFLLFCALLGMLGSFTSVRRYLKVS